MSEVVIDHGGFKADGIILRRRIRKADRMLRMDRINLLNFCLVDRTTILIVKRGLVKEQAGLPEKITAYVYKT